MPKGGGKGGKERGREERKERKERKGGVRWEDSKERVKEEQ